MQQNPLFAVGNPLASLRPWFDRPGLRMRMAFIRGKVARRTMIALRPDRLLAQLGASAARQIALLPRDITDLVEQVLLVETEAIRWGGRPPREYRNSGLAILDGDWDTCCKQPIDTYLRSDVFGSAVHDLFVKGRHYTDTTQYSQMVERLMRGRTPKKCASIDDIHAYFERLHRAYQMIKTEGYKSQVELATGQPHDEIMVYVDRNGELHKQQGSGHHRLAMARLLKVQHVPVCILGVHRRWVEQCHRRFGGDVISALRRGMAEQLAVKPLCSTRFAPPDTHSCTSPVNRVSVTTADRDQPARKEAQ